jgi:hypothetical protein
MTSALAYDPRTKQRIKEGIFKVLYSPVIKDHKNQLAELILKNSKLCQKAQVCFKYKGEVYTTEPGKLIPRPVNWLDQSLFTEMEEYLEDVRLLEVEELPYVQAYITQVLNSSDSFQDYYKLFPESLHSTLKQLEESCPCRRDLLKPEQIERIQRQNVRSVGLMKRRMMYNVLLTS